MQQTPQELIAVLGTTLATIEGQLAGLEAAGRPAYRVALEAEVARCRAYLAKVLKKLALYQSEFARIAATPQGNYPRKATGRLKYTQIGESHLRGYGLSGTVWWKDIEVHYAICVGREARTPRLKDHEFLWFGVGHLGEYRLLVVGWSDMATATPNAWEVL